MNAPSYPYLGDWRLEPPDDDDPPELEIDIDGEVDDLLDALQHDWHVADQPADELAGYEWDHEAKLMQAVARGDLPAAQAELRTFFTLAVKTRYGLHQPQLTRTA